MFGTGFELAADNLYNGYRKWRFTWFSMFVHDRKNECSFLFTENSASLELCLSSWRFLTNFIRSISQIRVPNDEENEFQILFKNFHLQFRLVCWKVEMKTIILDSFDPKVCFTFPKLIESFLKIRNFCSTVKTFERNFSVVISNQKLTFKFTDKCCSRKSVVFEPIHDKQKWFQFRLKSFQLRFCSVLCCDRNWNLFVSFATKFCWFETTK